MILISIVLHIFDFVAKINSYFNANGNKISFTEDQEELQLVNEEENISTSNGYERFSENFQDLYFSDFLYDSDDSSSCMSQYDSDSLPERILNYSESCGNFSGNQNSLKSRWLNFKRRMKKWICCSSFTEDSDR